MHNDVPFMSIELCPMNKLCMDTQPYRNFNVIMNTLVCASLFAHFHICSYFHAHHQLITFSNALNMWIWSEQKTFTFKIRLRKLPAGSVLLLNRTKVKIIFFLHKFEWSSCCCSFDVQKSWTLPDRGNRWFLNDRSLEVSQHRNI